MFPIRDVNPAERRPVVTYGLLAANVGIFVVAWAIGLGRVEPFVRMLGVVPIEIVTLAHPLAIWQPLTSMFMHASWAHLLGNMWFLHVFGDNVEDRLGHVRYALLYVLAGLCAVAVHVLLAPAGTLPLVGASGAIAGVLGAYVLRFPHARIITWVLAGIAEVPAFVFLFVWFGFQLLMTFVTIGSVARGGIAFAAHAGGFVAGMALDRLLGPRQDAAGARAGRNARAQR